MSPQPAHPPASSAVLYESTQIPAGVTIRQWQAQRQPTARPRRRLRLRRLLRGGRR